MNLLSGSKKYVLIGILFVLLAAIPLTVYFLQQQQQTESQAQKATTLYFATPGQTTAAATVEKPAGETIPLDIIVDPGTNQVSFIKLSVSYDGAKLSLDQANGIKQNEASFPSVLEGPTYTNGNVSVTVSIGADPTKVAQLPTKVATLTFTAKEATGSTPTQVKFIDGQTQVLSIASSDQPSENVLATTKPVNITITNASSSATPTSSNPQPTTAGVAPTCDSLAVAPAASGMAPFTVNLTANGTGNAGVINKVTFNFGDGPVQDVTQSGGIGTKTVSAQTSHAYSTAGTFQASAILTDASGNVSSGTCTKTITVTGGTGGGGATKSATVQPTAAPIAAAPTPTIAPAGPGDTIVKGGFVAAIISIVGALMFFAL